MPVGNSNPPKCDVDLTKGPSSAGNCPGDSDGEFARRKLNHWPDKEEVGEAIQAGLEILKKIDPAAHIKSLVADDGFSLSDSVAEVSELVYSGSLSSK